MRLAVFDFDGTLFRSPEAPIWAGKGWFVNVESLGPPCVPEKPEPNWWVSNTVSAARGAISDQNTWAVLITGRVDSIFRWRIPELLKAAGLNFDEVHLNTGGDTPLFKMKTMARILSRNRFKTVEIWEDQEKFLRLYTGILSRAGYEVKTHLVRIRPMKALCSLGQKDPERKPKKFVYEALVLPDRKRLLAWWLRTTGRKLLPHIYADHVTIKMTEEMEPEVGRLGFAQINGWFDNGKTQTVTVKTQGFTSENEYPHITIATAPGISPKETNTALSSGRVVPVQGPILKGLIGVSDGSRWYFRNTGMKKLSSVSKKSLALIRFLSQEAVRMGVAQHTYVVGGAVRDWILKHPIKDVDIVIDSVASKMDSEEFAEKLSKKIPAPTSLTTNQYGVAILNITGDWILGGHNLKGEQIEIANARKESYLGEGGKGYKPTEVTPSTIKEDVGRREFTFNSLMWRLLDLVKGPDRAEIIDLTGCGLRDLQEGRIRCPQSPDQTFRDDPTRMLRVFKFAGRYGFAIPKDVAASIRRNGHKLKEMPYHAVGKIFVDNILKGPRPAQMLIEMQKVGLIKVLRELAEENSSFASYLYGQTKSIPNPKLVLYLQKALGIRTPMSFLTPEQLKEVVSILGSLPLMRGRLFIESLKKPAVDNMRVITTLDLPPQERGRISRAARELLIRYPRLAGRDLTSFVLHKIKRDLG